MAVKKIPLKDRTPEEQEEVRRKRMANLRPFDSENGRERELKGRPKRLEVLAKRRDLKEFYRALLSTKEGQKLVDDAIVRSFKAKNPAQSLKIANDILVGQKVEVSGVDGAPLAVNIVINAKKAIEQ